MIQIIVTFLIQNVFASTSGGHHDEGIPAVVFYQAINVSIFFGILFWFSKDKVRALFQQRLSDFHRLAQETEKARKDLEFKKEDLVRRSKQLHETKQKSLEEAKREAEKIFNDEIEKSKNMSLKMSKDVEAQIKADQQKAIEKLRIETLELSVAAAETQISSIDTSEKQKINKQVQQRIEGATL
jgi:F0F1-type ATP synthase membrane subunit b/b'